MANIFAHNKKTRIMTAALADACVYTKSSKSGLGQESFFGKKLGQSYTVYVPGVPKVVNGIEAEPGEIVEVETTITLDSDNTSIELTQFNMQGDLEQFADEVAKPYAVGLARTQEKKIIADNIYKSSQAIVAATAGYGIITKSGAALRNLAVSGEVDMFLSPDVNGAIAESGLSKFNESAIAKRLYNDAYIGRYSGVEVVESPDLPELTTPSTIPSATITLGDAVVDADSNALGFAVINKITAAGGLIPGLAYKATGLKVVDCNGIQTGSDYAIVVTKVNAAGTEGEISPLRITLDGKAFNNANAWVPTGTTTLTLTALLDASTTYYVQSARAKEALIFDSYKWENVPSSDEEIVNTVGNRSLKMTMFGKAGNLNKFVRLDAPYAAGVWEPRLCTVVYVKKA